MNIPNTPVPNQALKYILEKNGLRIEEDDHVITLKHGDTVIQRFSATGATADAILIDAQGYLDSMENGG
jgi:hypothetical protein